MIYLFEFHLFIYLWKIKQKLKQKNSTWSHKIIETFSHLRTPLLNVNAQLFGSLPSYIVYPYISFRKPLFISPGGMIKFTWIVKKYVKKIKRFIYLLFNCTVILVIFYYIQNSGLQVFLLLLPYKVSLFLKVLSE